ncbi:hypothetical protein IU450_25275 [Nocardia abscessus]|uniref:hypothetical protein n=1 Tax=Nocardia abscessus TaxID=120957 RepID=UPI00189374C2|nr:hypothetical protein [Nocardia abscessus]MBF6339180.1 hypothetical protein [Nocardia abscessus]
MPAQTEPGLSGSVLTVAEFREVLDTALFAASGRGRVAFVHQPYAEFLAAAYLARRGVTGQRLISVLGADVNGLVPGPMIEVLSWLLVSGSPVPVHATCRTHPRHLHRLLDHAHTEAVVMGQEVSGRERTGRGSARARAAPSPGVRPSGSVVPFEDGLRVGEPQADVLGYPGQSLRVGSFVAQALQGAVDAFDFGCGGVRLDLPGPDRGGDAALERRRGWRARNTPATCRIELVHTSIRRYQRPNGEVIALLVIAP